MNVIRNLSYSIRQLVLVTLLVLGLGNEIAASGDFGCSPSTVDKEGAIHTGACSIPFSPLTSEIAKHLFTEQALAAQSANIEDVLPSTLSLTTYILKLRELMDGTRQHVAEDMAKVFAVNISPEDIGGVPTDIVVPRHGVSERNRNRVLINLHGGGMIFGARYEGEVMSIPIASLGRIKVITINYRMAPEYRFPAASEDVAAVYAALLKRYRPDNIGIYGCSSGGDLAAQSLAWFLAHKMPVPGAVGLLCSSGARDDIGDSYYEPTTPAFSRDKRLREAVELYASAESPQNFLVYPFTSPAVIARFPPTLFINATRDGSMSSTLHSHLQLVKAGVHAELYVWEGLDHAFMYDTRLPESYEVYKVVVDFFERHLGRAQGRP